MITREQMRKNVKEQLPWLRIDRRMHYSAHYHNVVRGAIEDIMDKESLRIAEDGNLYHGSRTEFDHDAKWFKDYRVFTPNNVEVCPYDEQNRRIISLERFILGCR